MDRMIYTAMTGANATSQRQQILANNLANVSTPGFRAELATFRAVPVRGDGSTTRVFALEATAGHLEAPGPINPTGRNLDVAAKGNAYFGVQGLDGIEAYTRAGAFEVNADGSLVTAQGYTVLSDGGAPIVVPNNAQLDIGSDGTVNARVGEAQARVQSGALEGSNVNPIEAMVGMIAVSRQFELQMRMLQNGETNDKTASQLLSMNG